MRAGSLSACDRFQEAETEAQEALRLAMARGDALLAERARVTIAYARISRFFLRLPGRPRLWRWFCTRPGLRLQSHAFDQHSPIRFSRSAFFGLDTPHTHTSLAMTCMPRAQSTGSSAITSNN